MSEEHKQILIVKRSYLVEYFDASDEVLDYFYQEYALTVDHCQTIVIQKTPEDRCRKLLDILPTRCDYAFYLFDKFAKEAGIDLFSSTEIVEQVHFFYFCNVFMLYFCYP